MKAYFFDLSITYHFIFLKLEFKTSTIYFILFSKELEKKEMIDLSWFLFFKQCVIDFGSLKNE